MASPDEPQGDQSPGTTPLPDETRSENLIPDRVPDTVSENPYYSSDYTYGSSQPGNTLPQEPPVVSPGGTTAVTTTVPHPFRAELPPPPISAGGNGRLLPPPPGSGDDDGDDEESGMLRMSFLDHLEELRRRIFYALGGFIVAFMLSLTFCKQLWAVVSEPAVSALTALGVKPPNLSQITPMEAFNVIWVKVPVLVSIFLASPWLLYQIWAFIAPGLYKRERRWAVPFVVSTAGLFITGGLFAYFVAFRYGLTFLLGIGRDVHVTPLVSINEYFDLFVNVTLGIGLVFELPILIFFLTLLRLVTPKFLLKHSRYAILIIVIIAAVVTPTPDVFNLLLFATPMIVLFYIGLFASYILVLSREGRRLPWMMITFVILGILLLLGAAGWYTAIKMHYFFIPHWPFLTR